MSTAQGVGRAMTAAEWALLVLLATLWAGSFFFNAVAVAELPVFTVVVTRVVLAASILLVVLRVTGRRLPGGWRVWTALMVMGLINNALPFSLIVAGQQYIASGAASVLNASSPLFTVLLAHLLTTDEKMSGGKLCGVLVGFLGVAVMVGADAARSLGTNVAAQFLCLAAALSYAAAAIYGRRFRSLGIDPMVTATGQAVASSLMMVPLVLVVDRPWTLSAPSAAAIASLICVAALSTALAYVIYFRLLATAGATNIQLVTFLVPAGAIMLGVLFLGESLLPHQIAGMALIGLGLAAIDGRPWRWLTGRPG